MQSLQKLYLINTNIPNEAIIQLKEKLPNCQIVYSNS